MIYELKQSQFSKVSHLLKSKLINLEIKSVVEGYNPGWVFVDNIEEPKTAMVWSRGIKGFYFVGDANNLDFNNNIDLYIDKEITPRGKELEYESFEFSGTSKEWDENLKTVFKNRNIHMSKQFVYKHNIVESISFNNLELEEDYILKEINEDLLENKQYNLEFVKSAIYEWWDSIDDFIKNGVGFCILHKDAAVCSCVTSFMTDDSMESHIQTQEAHGKKGLATKAVAEFIKYCRENQYKPYWDCMEKNYGSRALAEKFGYNKEFEYFLYEFKLK